MGLRRQWGLTKMLSLWVVGWNSYNILKKQMQGGDPNYVTSPSQHLLAAAEASQSNASPSFMFVVLPADEDFLGDQARSRPCSRIPSGWSRRGCLPVARIQRRVGLIGDYGVRPWLSYGVDFERNDKLTAIRIRSRFLLFWVSIW
jgi:hypothetical protein